MSKILFTKIAQPPTPTTNKAAIYVDTTDKKLKEIDDAGLVRVFGALGDTSTWTGVQTLTTPNIGAATGTSLAVTGTVTSSGTTGIGYATGSGGAVTQATSRSTGVTLNKICGTITGNATSLAASTSAVFTVTNSTVALRDVILLSHVSGSTANTSIFEVSAVAAGSFNIRIANISTATADTGAPIINFVVIKAVNA